MTAYVLITAEVGKLSAIRDRLISEGMKAAVVAGVYDLIAIVETEGQEQLARVVLDVIQEIPGVMRTVTLVELR